MRNILIIGGSRGIGNSILNHQLSIGNHCTNISRSSHDVDNENYKGYQADITKDELPEIDSIDSLVYCPRIFVVTNVYSTGCISMISLF